MEPIFLNMASLSHDLMNRFQLTPTRNRTDKVGQSHIQMLISRRLANKSPYLSTSFNISFFAGFEAETDIEGLV